jgi:hypothetical protein
MSTLRATPRPRSPAEPYDLPRALDRFRRSRLRSSCHRPFSSITHAARRRPRGSVEPGQHLATPPRRRVVRSHPTRPVSSTARRRSAGWRQRQLGPRPLPRRPLGRDSRDAHRTPDRVAPHQPPAPPVGVVDVPDGVRDADSYCRPRDGRPVRTSDASHAPPGPRTTTGTCHSTSPSTEHRHATEDAHRHPPSSRRRRLHPRNRCRSPFSPPERRSPRPRPHPDRAPSTNTASRTAAPTSNIAKSIKLWTKEHPEPDPSTPPDQRGRPRRRPAPARGRGGRASATRTRAAPRQTAATPPADGLDHHVVRVLVEVDAQAKF